MPAHIGREQFERIRQAAYSLPQVVKPADYIAENSAGFEAHLDKLGLVLLLSAFHGALAKCTKDFAADANTHDVRFYRIMNEVPTLLMIGIVILVIVRPF